MNKRNMSEDDALIGIFQAVEPLKIWLLFLIGPLAILSIKTYFIAATKKGICFHKLSLLGKFKNNDFFEFEDIKQVNIGKGILQRPMKFAFQNNRKVKVNAQLRGLAGVATLTPDVQLHIERNTASA